MIKKVKTNLKNDLKEKFKTKILCEKKQIAEWLVIDPCCVLKSFKIPQSNIAYSSWMQIYIKS